MTFLTSVAEVEEEEPEDKSVTRMKSVISAMVNKLKVKIDTTEKVLSDKLRVLDRDDDGEISYDDVKEFIGKVMKQNSSTEESVVQLFSLLDSNKDGKVSVAELLHYIHKKKESMEEEKLKVRFVRFIFRSMRKLLIVLLIDVHRRKWKQLPRPQQRRRKKRKH